MRLHEHFNQSGHFLFRFRSYLPLLIFIPGLFLYFQSPIVMSSLSEVLFFAIGFLGLVIRAYVIGFAHKSSSGRNTEKQIADNLNTQDLYSLCRNPLYFGNFLLWFSVVSLIGSFSFAVISLLAFWLFYERIIFTEEQFLSAKFGAQYDDWAARTPAFFPNVFLYQSSGKRFDWQRVFRQEKNGLLALFSIFALLEMAEMLVEDGTIHGDADLVFFIAGLAVSCLIYGHFKLQKYRHHKAKLL